MAIKNPWLDRYSSEPMQEYMRYALTHACGAATIAIDAVASDIQSSGGELMFINGFPYLDAGDAAYDISAELPYATWAVDTAYTTMGTASEVVGSDGNHYVCILAHTSAVANEPGVGTTWATYWKQLKRWAKAAAGDILPDGYSRYYLVCTLYDGTLRIFNAYDPENPNSGVLHIPWYDPERYCPLGFLLVANASAANFILGTTLLSAAGITDTYIDVIGRVYPNASFRIKN